MRLLFFMTYHSTVYMQLVDVFILVANAFRLRYLVERAFWLSSVGCKKRKDGEVQ